MTDNPRPTDNRQVELFEHQWVELAEVPEWDDLCEEVYRGLIKAVRNPQGLRILEVGCGTGRISARLAAEGAAVSMLDASPAAIQIARRQLALRDAKAEIVQGDMFSLPYDDCSFDVVWSAGVVEHYANAECVAALREMKRVTSPRGVVVTMVPNSLSVGYRIAKCYGSRTGTWPDEDERSFRSLRKLVYKAGLHTVREWQVARCESLAFFLAHFNVRGAVRVGKPVIRLLNTLGFGGYLLVNMARKQAENE